MKTTTSFLLLQKVLDDGKLHELTISKMEIVQKERIFEVKKAIKEIEQGDLMSIDEAFKEAKKAYRV